MVQHDLVDTCDMCHQSLPAKYYEVAYAKKQDSQMTYEQDGIYMTKETTTSYKMLGKLSVFLCDGCRQKSLNKHNFSFGVIPAIIVIILLVLLLLQVLGLAFSDNADTIWVISILGIGVLAFISIAAVYIDRDEGWFPTIFFVSNLVLIFGVIFLSMEEGTRGLILFCMCVYVAIYISAIVRAYRLSDDPTFFENKIKSLKKDELASINKVHETPYSFGVTLFNSKDMESLKPSSE